MNTIVYVAAAIAEAIAAHIPKDQLGITAALLTSVGDQLALLALCQESEGQESGEQ